MKKILKLLHEKYGVGCCLSIEYWHHSTGNTPKEYVIYIDNGVRPTERFTDKSKLKVRLRELLRG